MTSSSTVIPAWLFILQQIFLPPRYLPTVEDEAGIPDEHKRRGPYGAMIYNRNRLIESFRLIGAQKKRDCEGVVMIVDTRDDLKPCHNKQVLLKIACLLLKIACLLLKIACLLLKIADTTSRPSTRATP